MLIPDKQIAELDVNERDLVALTRELIEHSVSDDSIDLLGKLASQPPDIRLAINLKSLIGCMLGSNQHHNVMLHGITHAEREALVELDVKNISVRGREIAHGLLNIYERWLVMKKLGPVFQKYRPRRGAYVNIHGVIDDLFN